MWKLTTFINKKETRNSDFLMVVLSTKVSNKFIEICTTLCITGLFLIIKNITLCWNKLINHLFHYIPTNEYKLKFIIANLIENFQEIYTAWLIIKTILSRILSFKIFPNWLHVLFSNDTLFYQWWKWEALLLCQWYDSTFTNFFNSRSQR